MCKPVAGIRAGESPESKTGVSMLTTSWALSILASLIFREMQKRRSLSVESTIQLCPASKLRTFEMTLFANPIAAVLAPFTGAPLGPREFCTEWSFEFQVCSSSNLGFTCFTGVQLSFLNKGFNQLGLRVESSQHHGHRQLTVFR